MKKNGFTLIELLIVMAIAVILLLLAIFGSRSGQDTTVLTTAVNDFVSEVTYVRDSAISGLNKVNGIELRCAKSGVAGACVHNWIYGFYIEPSNIYAGSCQTTYCYRYSVVMAVKDLTPASIFALFIAFLIGSVVGLLLVSLKIKSMKSMIPFGPFLSCGVVLYIIFYQYLQHLVYTIFFI